MQLENTALKELGTSMEKTLKVSGGPERATAPETDAMRASRAAREERIAERESLSQRTSEARRQEASRQLEEMRAEQQEAIRLRKASNRSGGGPSTGAVPDFSPGPWDEEEPFNANEELRKRDVPWADVLRLMETLPKPSMRAPDGSLVGDKLLGVVRKQAGGSL